MLIQKSLETRLDFADPLDIINPDVIGLCTRHLTEKYVGKCYMSCLILNINKIIRHSLRYMSRDLSGSAYISVTFEVDAIVYIKGEILNGCHIVKIESDGRIHAKSKHAGIQIRQDASLVNIYKEGQIVPFIVNRVQYNPAQNAASVEAVPFTPVFPDNIIYSVGKPLGEEGKTRIQDLFRQIDKLKSDIDMFDSNSQKALGFFQDLVYPFKKDTDFNYKVVQSGGAKASKIEFTWDSIKNVRGYICQPVESKIQSGVIYHFKDRPEGKVCEENLVSILDKFLSNVIRHYQEMIEFVGTYPTFAKVQEYKDIWRMYNMLKR
jgi:hypothetical protein